MLELKTYTKAELTAAYKTGRLDYIKRKITAEGYKYTDSGRADNYKMTITELPNNFNQFKRYCIDELKIDYRTNFELLAEFLKRILGQDNFINLQYEEMARQMKGQGIKIDRNTAAKYFKMFYAMNWYSYSIVEFKYYIYDYTIEASREITKEEFAAAWTAFREGTYNSTNEAVKHLYDVSGTTPKKEPIVELNGIYLEQINKIKEWLGV